jgi:uracil-DNA glycosylase
MGYPKECNLCRQKKITKGIGIEDLKLSVKPFQKGKNPYVMLVGLNPTLTKKQVKVVFELDDDDSTIYKYIVQDILPHVGLKIDDIYATNLVKCTFSQEPRIICERTYGKKDNKTVKTFLSPFFQNCRRYFTEEIMEINPKILISFGEVPHQLIVDGFNLTQQNVNVNMKEAFGNIYRVPMHGRDVFYVPCIRLVAKNHPYFRNSWEMFVKRLKETVNPAQ